MRKIHFLLSFMCLLFVTQKTIGRTAKADTISSNDTKFLKMIKTIKTNSLDSIMKQITSTKNPKWIKALLRIATEENKTNMQKALMLLTQLALKQEDQDEKIKQIAKKSFQKAFHQLMIKNNTTCSHAISFYLQKLSPEKLKKLLPQNLIVPYLRNNVKKIQKQAATLLLSTYQNQKKIFIPKLLSFLNPEKKLNYFSKKWKKQFQNQAVSILYNNRKILPQNVSIKNSILNAFKNGEISMLTPNNIRKLSKILFYYPTKLTQENVKTIFSMITKTPYKIGSFNSFVLLRELSNQGSKWSEKVKNHAITQIAKPNNFLWYMNAANLLLDTRDILNEVDLLKILKLYFRHNPDVQQRGLEYFFKTILSYNKNKKNYPIEKYFPFFRKYLTDKKESNLFKRKLFKLLAKIHVTKKIRIFPDVINSTIANKIKKIFMPTEIEKKHHCSYIRLDQPHIDQQGNIRMGSMLRVPVRSQGSFGICYSISATQIFESIRNTLMPSCVPKKPLSAIQTAFRYKSHTNQNSYSTAKNGKIKTVLRGGFTCPALQAISGKRACIKSTLDPFFLKDPGYSKMKRIIEKFNKTHPYSHSITSFKDFLKTNNCIHRQSAFGPQLKKILTVLLKTQQNEMKRFKKIIQKTCKNDKCTLQLQKKFLKEKKTISCNQHKILNRKNGYGLSIINKVLDKSPPIFPIGISYCSNFLNNKSFIPKSYKLKDCGRHASLIIGRRLFKNKNGSYTCQYLIRNSWGKNCNYPWLCENGNVWVNKDALEKNLISTQSINVI